MTSIRRLAQRDPSGLLTVINLVAGAVAAALGRPEFTPVFVAVAGLVLGLRTQVTPVAKANETAVSAARQAAMATAANLGDGTAGRLGEVTDRGTEVINEAVGMVSDLLAKRPPAMGR